MKLRFATIALLSISAPWALAQDQYGAVNVWVPTWAAAPLKLVPPAQPPANGQPAPITSFHNQTVRMMLHTSISGRRLRVQLSNLFGSAPLDIGSAHIAVRAKEAAIIPASDRTITVNSKPAFTIFPGTALVSDPVDLVVPETGDLALSVYIPGDSGTVTAHTLGMHTTYISQPGNFTGAQTISEAKTSRSYYWVTGVDLFTPLVMNWNGALAEAGTIVTLGDSITDGFASTPDTNRSWPSILAQRVLSNPSTGRMSVINLGISGNRLLRDLAGPSALMRFDRDVLSQPNVRWVTLMEGINDIGRATGPNRRPNEDPVTADELIGAMKQIIERSHEHGIKVLGGTLTPYQGAAYYSEAGEVIRQAVNQWIRTSGAFDAVVDFDAIERDPSNPKTFRADFNERDHLHPNDAGYKAMAEAIDLGLFTPKTMPRGSR